MPEVSTPIFMEKFLLEVSHFSHKLQLSNLTVDQYGYHNNTKHHGNCCESLHFSFLVLPMTCVGSFTVATMVIYTFKNIVVISQTCQTSHKLIHLNLHARLYTIFMYNGVCVIMCQPISYGSVI